jgi:hypothetical protein
MYNVSFDFDDTLSRLSVQAYAHQLVVEGFNVFICTAREGGDSPIQNRDLKEVIKNVGIPEENVLYAGIIPKFHFLLDKNILFHLDDDRMTVKELNEHGVTGVICGIRDNKWLEECEKIIESHSISVSEDKLNSKSVSDRLKLITGEDLDDSKQVVNQLIKADEESHTVRVVVLFEDKFFECTVVKPNNWSEEGFAQLNKVNSPIFKETKKVIKSFIQYEK